MSVAVRLYTFFASICSHVYAHQRASVSAYVSLLPAVQCRPFNNSSRQYHHRPYCRFAAAVCKWKHFPSAWPALHTGGARIGNWYRSPGWLWKCLNICCPYRLRPRTTTATHPTRPSCSGLLGLVLVHSNDQPLRYCAFLKMSP